MRFTHKNGNHREKLRSLLLESPEWRGEVRQLGFSCIEGKGRGTKRAGREERKSLPCLFFFFFLSSFLNGRVRLLVLLSIFDVRTAVHVFGARVYRILLAPLWHFLVDDTRVLVILVILVAGRDVRLASCADVTRSLLVAATSRCNKQRHDRSRQMCVCGFYFFLFFFVFFIFIFMNANLLITKYQLHVPCILST